MGEVHLRPRSRQLREAWASPARLLYHVQKFDLAADAARLEDQARVKAEAAAAEASGKNVELVFVERGGSSSAKRALGKLEKRLKGNAVWVRNKLV